MSAHPSALGYAAFAGLLLSIAAYAASAAALLAARRRARGEPVTGWEPGVSIVKPLCGIDEDLEENLESFFRLDYGVYEVVFSFASEKDPAYPIARRVADRHFRIPSVFVFDAREPGGNAKVNRLTAALRHTRHRLILFSDGNVRVRPDFLRRAVSWFEKPPAHVAGEPRRVGLVSHLFLARGATGMASRIESLYLNGCLQGGTAFLSVALRMPCVVGKSILVSRRALDAVEGIEALRGHLAEDFLLGRSVRRAGYGVALSADFVDTSEVRKNGARRLGAPPEVGDDAAAAGRTPLRRRAPRARPALVPRHRRGRSRRGAHRRGRRSSRRAVRSRRSAWARSSAGVWTFATRCCCPCGTSRSSPCSARG